MQKSIEFYLKHCEIPQLLLCYLAARIGFHAMNDKLILLFRILHMFMTRPSKGVSKTLQ